MWTLDSTGKSKLSLRRGGGWGGWMSQSNTAFFLKGDHRVRMINYICISVHNTFDSLQQMDLQRADVMPDELQSQILYYWTPQNNYNK